MVFSKNFILLISFITLAFIKANYALNDDKKQDAKCLLPLETGPCRMSLTRFYYNAKTDTCEEFKFGGCKGNDNKFGFKQTCEAACKKQTTTPSIKTSATEKALTNTETAAASASTPKPVGTAGTTAKITSSTPKIGTTSKPKK